MLINFIRLLLFSFLLFSCQEKNVNDLKLSVLCQNLHNTFVSEDSLTKIFGKPVRTTTIKNPDNENEKVIIVQFNNAKILYLKNIHTEEKKPVYVNLYNSAVIQKYGIARHLKPKHVLKFLGNPSYYSTSYSGQQVFQYVLKNCSKFRYLTFYFKDDKLIRINLETSDMLKKENH